MDKHHSMPCEYCTTANSTYYKYPKRGTKTKQINNLMWQCDHCKTKIDVEQRD